MKILVTGAGGQLGHYLQEQVLKNEQFEEVQLIACASNDLDITDLPQIMAVLNECRPDIVINAAAYTQVDLAETQVEQARLINATAVSYLAEVCANYTIPLIQVSTDYVFDGRKQEGYQADDQTNPINIYGQTKLEGEQYALAYERGYVVRTSWVYSEFGRNFANTMRRLFNDRDEIAVVNDQIGCPTHASDLAHFLLTQSMTKQWGENQQRIHHYTSQEVMSWHDLALKIFEQEQQKHPQLHCKINTANSDSYPTTAKRPQYSILK